MSWIDFVGYVAALTVPATFCMNTIVPLRKCEIAHWVAEVRRGRSSTVINLS
jgi:hypothetical protein